MILGDLFSSGPEVINESLIQTYKKPGKISSVLSLLSRYGMSYDDQVYKNMKAVPADSKLVPDEDKAVPASIWGSNFNWKTKPEEEKKFSEKTLDQKRQVLRKLATQPEIENILDIMANECIVYDDEEAYICKPYIDNAVIQDLNEKSLESIRSAVDTIFYRMYLLAGWKNHAWDVFRRWLVDGDIAYEIVYDDIEDPKNIIGIVDLDPATLTKTVKNGVQYWVQYKDVIGRERILYDTQVIYIKYEDSGVIDRQSYLERLIRPFNIYRIVEQAQVIWTVTQSSFKTVFTIPLNGMSRARGLQTLNAAMNRYKEDISFNGDTGEIQVNGKMNLPFTRDFFMPENENGSPKIETLTDQGPALMDSDQLKFFESKVYKMSKIPESRFDRDAQSTWFGTDPSQQLRDEINFSRFTGRLQHAFSQILLKPMTIQLALQMPELKNDKRILDAIGLRFNSYNQFVELMEQQIDMSRMEHIQSLKDTFTTVDEEGNEEHYFCDTFLLVKYLKMSDADLELNEKYKELEKAKKKKSNPEETNDEGEGNDSELDAELGLETGSEENNEETEGDNEIDQEMQGDVNANGETEAEA